jgi:hypothetical protein
MAQKKDCEYLPAAMRRLLLGTCSGVAIAVGAYLRVRRREVIDYIQTTAHIVIAQALKERRVFSGLMRLWRYVPSRVAALLIGNPVPALELACALGHCDGISWLLAHHHRASSGGVGVPNSCDPALPNKLNRIPTPLHIACNRGHADVVALLLRYSAAVDVLCLQMTPLSMACEAGHADCARVLLEHLADHSAAARSGIIEQVNSNGITAMLIACYRGHHDCVALLSSYGAQRSVLVQGQELWAEAAANHMGHAALVAWLARSHFWTPLHHIEVLSVGRARALLRDGASVHALRRRRSLIDLPYHERAARAENVESSPLDLARAWLSDSGSRSLVCGATGGGSGGDAIPTLTVATDEGAALSETVATPPVEQSSSAVVAAMIVLAAGPWCAESHELFPAHARQRARELLPVLYALSFDPRLDGGPPPRWLVHRLLSLLITRNPISQSVSQSSPNSTPS